ncbi:Putative tubulin-tyrosine ligase [Klebsormidium nitens]|uniref:Putative tubulin-tyrosine ligase n=1 Tax=Klebsormidium nitens TaxID=105231 RepID=A0A1Y1I280_KLENI|nr:Putative tubulin-tyrosine ligase [Klebsormidium nitens]|eukprot:GAQ82856.1 Putative tubulin-tyrosine ligase [Klebsormidium nitens]
MEFEDFVQVHGVLLAASGLPQSLHKVLHQKLTQDVFDGGQHFQVEEVEVEGGVQRRLVASAERLDKESDVFLVDHTWSFRLAGARKQLEAMPTLVERMAALMSVADTGTEEEEGADPDGTSQSVEAVLTAAEQAAREKGAPVRWLELDECGLDDAGLVALKLGEKYPDLVGLSLWGNKIATTAALLEALGGLLPLRALWLNDNPVYASGTADVLETLQPRLPLLEVFSSRATDHYFFWALGLFASVYGADAPGVDGASGHQRHPLWTVHELDLSGRGLQRLKPELFNETEAPTLQSLDLTDNPLSAQDASELETLLARLPSLQSLKIDVPGPLGATLKDVADALPKVTLINGLERDTILAAKGSTPITASLHPRLPTWQPGEPLVERVLRAMWQFVNTYRLATEEKLDETPVWYVMDELGSAVRHSDRPTAVCMPFMYLPDGTLNSAVSYSLLWPCEDLRRGDECTRDFLKGITEDKQRSSRLTAWFHTPSNYFEQVFQDYKKKLAAVSPQSATPPPASEGPVLSIRPADGRPLKVFTDIREGMDHLNRPEFVQVDDPRDADIVWAFDQIDEASRAALGLRSDQYMNQFPFEACIVMKHHLAHTVKQAHGAPAWLQPTYELDSELPALIGDFQERERARVDNLWILKPWNMARSIDASVTRNLVQVIRSMETGPKICQKYIERPATFRGRKFDLRLVVLLRSVRPLEVLLYDVFWARFSNNPYTMDQSSLDDYETHFTVMNYGRKLENINMDLFVAEFETDHNVKWSGIHERIRAMLREVFEGAARVHPEMHDPHARAMYGVDVMLDSDMQPKLLEITYCPDTMRACKYDVPRLQDGKLLLAKDFYNRVFGSLFFREDDGFESL